MTTLKDIAAKAKVSVTTVSDVLNGKSRERRVSEKVTDLVKKIAKELNYQSHVHGRALALQKTFLVGLIVESLHTSFWGDIVAGFIEDIESLNYRVLLHYTKGDSSLSQAAYNDFLWRNVDGIAFLGGPIPDLSKCKCPLVNSHVSVKNSISVMVDQNLGVKLALDHLMQMGHQKLLIIGNNSNRGQISENYLKGKNVSCKKIKLGEVLDHAGKSYTAGFCTSDELALEVMTLVQNAGLRIPDDFSLVGFDNLKFASLVHPGLTSIDQPKKLYGQVLAKQLMTQLNGQKGQDILLEPELISRGSVIKI